MDLNYVLSRLSSITVLAFKARSQSKINTGWDGQGEGTVRVERVNSQTLIFHERGAWTPTGKSSLGFSNSYRWSWDSHGDTLRLEHLRFGENQPVYLFELKAAPEGFLNSKHPHLCQDDCYTARMELSDAEILLTWSVAGPEKNETIEYRYR